jgi:hypothetical protein
MRKRLCLPRGTRLAAVVLTGLLAVAVTGTGAEAEAAANVNPGVIPVKTSFGGSTYGEWAGRWWQWAVSAPPATNPLVDPSGANCAVGQSGNVWFLAGTLGAGSADRTCTIPRGKAIFFPVFNAFDANDLGDTRDFASVLNGARSVVAGVDASAKIDGREVRSIEQYYAESPGPFSFTIGDPNIFAAPAGTYSPVAAAGIHLLLTPLTPGHHEIKFSGTAGGITISAKYDLTVS